MSNESSDLGQHSVCSAVLTWGDPFKCQKAKRVKKTRWKTQNWDFRGLYRLSWASQAGFERCKLITESRPLFRGVKLLCGSSGLKVICVRTVFKQEVTPPPKNGKKWTSRRKWPRPLKFDVQVPRGKSSLWCDFEKNLLPQCPAIRRWKTAKWNIWRANCDRPGCTPALISGWGDSEKN